MIRPIDMQTLLMQLDKVGKDQAQNRDQVANQQAVEAQKLLKVEDQQAHAVNQGAQTETQGSKVKADDHAPSGHPEGHGGSGASEAPAEEEEKKKPATWKDPQLGTRVDITG